MFESLLFTSEWKRRLNCNKKLLFYKTDFGRDIEILIKDSDMLIGTVVLEHYV